MKLYYLVFACMSGLCIATFVGVMIDRSERGLSFVKGRSHCPNCKHRLAFNDMIPIVSYILLKGRCRYCHHKISKRDFLIEVIGGLWSLVCFFYYDTKIAVLVFLIGMLLLGISCIDWDTMMIYDRFLIMYAILVYLLTNFEDMISLSERLLGMGIISGFMLLMNCFVECFGGGDIKLMLIAGYWLGAKRCLLAFFIALITGGFYGIYLLLFKRVDRKSFVAFGPFLSFGILISYMFGFSFLERYFQLLM